MLIQWLFLLLPFVDFSDMYMVMTVPKSGTHLIQNLVERMTGKMPYFITQTNDLNPYVGYLPGKYYTTHFNGSFDFPELKRRIGNMPVVINVRDPRDVCVSSIHYFEFEGLIDNFEDMDERLSYTIQYEGIATCFGVLYHYLKALDAIEALDPLVIRYEDLVGPQGGGTLEAQLETIRAVAHKLHKSLSPQEVKRLAGEIYGHGPTFRQGKLHSWREVFKPHHIEQFKRSKLQQILVEFGYEKDDQW